MTDSKPAYRVFPRGVWLAGGLGLGIIAGLAALYGMKGGSRNANVAVSGNCGPAKVLAEKLEPVARGDVAAMKINATPQPVTPVTFSSHDGKKLSFADFAGKTILVNLWATWCAPCRAEMPALDRLQQELGGPDFEVVAINIDTNRLDRPRAFLNEVGVKSLSYYSDQSAMIFADLKRAGKAFGMPTTLLIDAKGCELGVMAGPAEWASQDARYFIRTALGK
ncbi:MAG: TlpA family protein disulfide reductase [Proteobacteria bacterium]|nr:TlpA family protein disulfide reductase [Pseudomonadota bacterium]